MTAKRESNFELLRILCMFIIILSHYSVHGGFDTALITNSFNKYFICCTGLGEIGVDCFVIISGYFLASASFRPSKWLKLEFSLLFYSITLGIAFLLLKPSAVNADEIFSILFPALTGRYWFISAYLTLYALIPFLNLFLKNASKKLLTYCLRLLLVLYVIVPTLTNYTMGGVSNTLALVIPYLLGAYIRLYPDAHSFFQNQRQNIGMALLSLITIFASAIFFYHVPIRHYTYLTDARSIPVVLCSFSLFLAFKNMNPFHSRWINQIAGSVLGVYLIHDNPAVRGFLWKLLFKNAQFGNSPLLIIHAAVSVLLVFCACAAADQLRIYLIEKPFFKRFQPAFDKLDTFFADRFS